MLVYRDSRPVGTASVNGFDCRFTIGAGAGEARGLVCRASYCVARARTARSAAPAGTARCAPGRRRGARRPSAAGCAPRHVLQRQVRRAAVADPGHGSARCAGAPAPPGCRARRRSATPGRRATPIALASSASPRGAHRPDVLSVKVGTTVRWTNHEKPPTHSVLFSDAGGFESERMFPASRGSAPSTRRARIPTPAARIRR